VHAVANEQSCLALDLPGRISVLNHHLEVATHIRLGAEALEKLRDDA
jgi:hypothetical protein